ncbi:MAG: MFS transporter [Pseudomonadota bacterium]
MDGTDELVPSPEDQLSWRLRLLYACGQLPEGVKTAAFGFYLLFYYNQVLGLSGSLAGIALFVALCIDAISDPFVGSWSDFTRSRWGRRHPFMYASILPFALTYFLLFVPPDDLGQTGLFLWLLFFAAATRLTMTFYLVPYLSLGAELTQNYDERTLLAALRNVLQLLGMFAVLIGANLLFFGATDAYPNGQRNPDAYLPFAFACAPLMVMGFLIAAAGTHERIPSLEQPGAAPRTGLVQSAIADVKLAFQIPAFAAVTSASVLFGINQGMNQALHLYTATYFFELTGNQVTVMFAGAIAGIVFGSLMSRPIAGLIREKRNVFIVGSAWYALWTSSVIILRLLDLIPGNEEPLVAVAYMSTACISAIGLGVAIPMIGSMIADVTDVHEHRHGLRQEGIYYAAASFAAKAVGGAGPIFAGFIIDLAGIVPGSAPSTVAPEAIERFGWAAGPSALALSAASIVAICYYSISRHQHAQIVVELAARKARVTSGVAG